MPGSTSGVCEQAVCVRTQSWNLPIVLEKSSGITYQIWISGRGRSEMFGMQKIVEQKIREAQTKGEFDNLPGRGRPIEIEDDSHVPEDLRMAYKILKNANCVPPEVALKKQIVRMEDMLDDLSDEREKYLHIRRINFKIMQLNMLRKTSPLLEDTGIYYRKVIDKLDGNKSGK